MSDNGREFWGRQESHPFELLLAMHEIVHRTTKIRTPRTHGFVERINRTLLDECFKVHGRTKWYTALEEIQRDLANFLRSCSEDRSHQRYRLNGRTPAQALREALGRNQLPPVVPDLGQEEEAG